MAQDEVIVKYKAVPEGFDKVGVAVNSVTQDTKELQTQIKATFADKSITEATANLDAHGDKVDEVGKKYTTAKAELRALTNEITSGKLGAKEMDAAVKRAADLTDHIGDVRNEIKKLSSDTRVFDLLAQGARGVAAGFSVATGLAASFGSENKDLQKTLMKVQGAMATLQGVQELANIATEKGGIATKAYGVALQVVDKISKVTGLSMAASWAIATAGLTALIALVIGLISYLGEADDAANDFEANRQADAAAATKRLVEQKEEQIKLLTSADKDFFDKQEIERRERLAKGEEANQVEFDMLTKSIEKYQNKVKGYQNGYYEYLGLTAEEEKSRIALFNDYINTAVISRNKIIDDGNKAALKAKEDSDKAFGNLQKKQIAEMRFMDKAIEEGLFATADHLQEFRDKIASQPDSQIEPLITEKTVEENKTNADQMAKDIRESYEKYKKDRELFDSTKLAQEAKMWSDSFALAQATVSAINSLVQFGYDSQLQALQLSKQREVEAAGDNAEKRKKVEQRYAIESAKIERQKAIAEKAAAIFGIGVALAQAIQKIQAEAAVLSSNPITAALAGNAYAQIGIAAGLSAIQIAVIAAKPLPAIPTFEHGGAVALAGGRIADGHLIGRSHRQGGILIEAQGKEYIWDEQTTAKHGDIIKAAHENRIEDLVFHKYVVPMMKSSFTPNAPESYDDKFLRSTIRQTSKQTAKDIVNGISKNMNDAIYLTQRYKN